MITIYHNNRCSKSRSALDILVERGIPHQVHPYLTVTLDVPALQKILSLLGMQPSELLRKNEAVYKELSQQPHTEKEWLELMAKHPQLIERPIVVNGNKAVVARPAERVLEIL